MCMICSDEHFETTLVEIGAFSILKPVQSIMNYCMKVKLYFLRILQTRALFLHDFHRHLSKYEILTPVLTPKQFLPSLRLLHQDFPCSLMPTRGIQIHQMFPSFRTQHTGQRNYTISILTVLKWVLQPMITQKYTIYGIRCSKEATESRLWRRANRIAYTFM